MKKIFLVCLNLIIFFGCSKSPSIDGDWGSKEKYCTLKVIDGKIHGINIKNDSLYGYYDFPTIEFNSSKTDSAGYYTHESFLGSVDKNGKTMTGFVSLIIMFKDSVIVNNSENDVTLKKF